MQGERLYLRIAGCLFYEDRQDAYPTKLFIEGFGTGSNISCPKDSAVEIYKVQ